MKIQKIDVQVERFHITYNDEIWEVDIEVVGNNIGCWLSLKNYGYKTFTCGCEIKNYESDRDMLIDNLFNQDYFVYYLEELEKLEA